ncbi:hypothetical protein Tco_0344276 [Tanacetum coccineum]
MVTSFRRSVRGGVEQQEFSDLSSFLNSVVLSTSNDRWYFSLSSSGEFSVKDTRLAIDDLVLPSHYEPTRGMSTLLFRCSLSQRGFARVCRWWEIDFQLWRSFSEMGRVFFIYRPPGFQLKVFWKESFYFAVVFWDFGIVPTLMLIAV